MGKYDVLGAFLAKQPNDSKVARMTFDEVDSILSEPLPRTARKDRPWWANTRSSPQGLGWLNAGWKVTRVNLAGKEVTFSRSDGAFGGDGLPNDDASNENYFKHTKGSYKNLSKFLQMLPSNQEQLALSFPELGEILGQNLPKVAAYDRPWWANTRTSPQGLSWLSSGWRVENIYLKPQIVVFRKAEDPLKNVPKYVKSLLGESQYHAHPSAQILAKWIKYCRQVHWYFECTVLYERTGSVLDALTEREMIEVEESYNICKRELNRYKVEA